MDGTERYNVNNLQNIRRGNVGDENEQYYWGLYELEDLFDPNWLPEFRRRRGVLVVTDAFQPVDFFRLYFPVEALQLIADETNRYAAQYFDEPIDLPLLSNFANGKIKQQKKFLRGW